MACSGSDVINRIPGSDPGRFWLRLDPSGKKMIAYS